MIAPYNSSAAAFRYERKVQLLGKADHKCIDCSANDARSLTRFRDGSIRCRNCKKKQRPLSATTERDRTSRLRKHGYASFRCTVCGERDLRVFESHHIAGAANTSLEVPLCGNCHAIQSDMQEDSLGALRLRDPERRPLLLQAAFDFGLGGLLAVLATAAEIESELRLFYAAVAVALIAWAVWNIAADKHFVKEFGPEYSLGVPVPIPR